VVTIRFMGDDDDRQSAPLHLAAEVLEAIGADVDRVAGLRPTS
jgi:hypothetical protein